MGRQFTKLLDNLEPFAIGCTFNLRIRRIQTGLDMLYFTSISQWLHILIIHNGSMKWFQFNHYCRHSTVYYPQKNPICIVVASYLSPWFKRWDPSLAKPSVEV